MLAGNDVFSTRVLAPAGVTGKRVTQNEKSIKTEVWREEAWQQLKRRVFQRENY